ADHAAIGIDLVHQHAPGKNPAGLVRQHFQQLELDGGKVQVVAIDGGLVGVGVEHQPLVGGLVAAVGTTQHGFYPCHYFAGAEGLADVVVGAEFQAQQPVDFVDLGGNHDDGQAGGLADVLADFHAVLAGQHQVEQY